MPTNILPVVTTISPDPYPWAEIASGTTTIVTPFTVDRHRGVRFNFRFGRRSGTAFTSGWPNIRVEGSVKTSGNDSWSVLWSRPIPAGASIANTTLSGAVLAGAATVAVASATNIATTDMLFLGDTSSANWEVVRIRSISGTTITLEEPCVFAHANAAQVTDQAEEFTSGGLPLELVRRVRIVIDNAGSGQAFALQITGQTYDSDEVVTT